MYCQVPGDQSNFIKLAMGVSPRQAETIGSGRGPPRVDRPIVDKDITFTTLSNSNVSVFVRGDEPPATGIPERCETGPLKLADAVPALISSASTDLSGQPANFDPVTADTALGILEVLVGTTPDRIKNVARHFKVKNKVTYQNAVNVNPSLHHYVDTLGTTPNFIARQWSGLNHHCIPHVVGGGSDFFKKTTLSFPQLTDEACKMFPGLCEIYDCV